MPIIPKHKLGTSTAIDKQKVFDYFNIYIDYKIEDTERESYVCKDGSVLILQPSSIEGKIFVNFHINIEVDYTGKIWFMQFCRENNTEIQNLRTGIIMPVSDGAIMSDLWSSEASRISRHFANNPKDKQKKGSRNK
jgi:hypothetical protein